MIVIVQQVSEVTQKTTIAEDIAIDTIAGVEITIVEVEVACHDQTQALAHWRPDQKVTYASIQMQTYSSTFAITASFDFTAALDILSVILLFPLPAWTNVLLSDPYQPKQELQHPFVYLHCELFGPFEMQDICYILATEVLY